MITLSILLILAGVISYIRVWKRCKVTKKEVISEAKLIEWTLALISSISSLILISLILILK